MRKLALLASIALFSVSMAGCACGPDHEAFVAQENSTIGRPIYSGWLKAKPGDQGFLGRKLLPNGNVEIGWIHGWGSRYRKGECRVYYEYNPATNIVISWRFEGSETDCVSVC